MTRARFGIVLSALAAATDAAATDEPDFDQPPHDYWKRPLADPFTRLKPELEGGRVLLDRGSDKAYVAGLLARLGIPVSSQLLVFSSTSLQLHFISPSNPRALYFNEDVYVGWVPGGRIEIVSVDPALGAIFYIFDVPTGAEPPRIERSDRCMNCHAAADTSFVPGLLVKSVLPVVGGGSLDSYRQREAAPGHAIPFDRRFGGWYVTGKHGLGAHHGNTLGDASRGGITTTPIDPGTTVKDLSRYPAATSDVLPHLLHEHQIGFVNRLVAAVYRTRSTPHADRLDAEADILTRYLLFADEVVLPAGGVTGDAAFREAFLRTRKSAKNGTSLKDLDGKTRLFKHRCSYMIYSHAFAGLPAELKQRVYRRLAAALNATPDAGFTYLPAAEKKAIRMILEDTLPDFRTKNAYVRQGPADTLRP